jgi:uncharacterized protein YbjT (DUF2867 family)
MTTNGMHPDNAKAKALAEALEHARRKLRIETFDERGSDRLDFHEVLVSNVRDAIEAAFEAGFAAGASSK